MINLPAQDPLFRSGSEVTNASGIVTFATGLLKKVEHLSVAFTNSGGKDEAKYDWAESATVPGQVTVTVYKAAGTAADTAVNFTWLAHGF